MHNENKTFEFVIYKENFLSNKECDKLIKTLDTGELTDGTVVGDYDKHPVNKNVRKVLNVDFHDENLYRRLNGAIKVANTQYFNYKIDSIDTLRFLKYSVGGTYKWHVDMGRDETSTRKLTAIIQLSEEKDYEGGDFEFSIANDEGDENYFGTRKKGSLINIGE